ncbi:hypothetical protein RvY_10570 [Ramazzottius varieornatus]|uniref:Small EDRK-rich factor-like N-terminal domain-containing protein n=1 Tax=Ramazzottius varieornatus TaxID=947166 RepID=A0A1D1VD75_RAMVA|nr:hypothetical protein RvY_10570 [Ramazzottius varieornatus]
MTRGNQRELARGKEAKKQAETSKKIPAGEREANKGLTLEMRKQRDAEALKKKQEAKAANSGGDCGK